MTEQGSHAERLDRDLVTRRLVGKALVDEYIDLDEANRIRSNSITEVLILITERIEQKGGNLQEVLEHWQMLGEVLEHLEKTE